jgi:site-specific recombinase XerD
MIPEEAVFVFMDIEQARRAYLDYLKYDCMLSATTIFSRSKELQLVIKNWGGKKPEDISFEDISDIRKIILDRKCSVGYLYKILFSVRGLFKYLKQVKKLEVIEYRDIKLPPQPRQNVEYLTNEEVVKFTSFPVDTIFNLRLKAFVVTLLDTGMRISEALSLQIKHIDFKEKKASIIGKGNKPRVVFFQDFSIDWIKAYIGVRNDNNPYLFVSHGRQFVRRIAPEDIRRYFRILGKCIGRRVTPHMMRRTFATRLLEQGTDLQAIQYLLGHSSLLITERYLGINYGRLQEVHTKNMIYTGVEKAPKSLDNVKEKIKVAFKKSACG